MNKPILERDVYNFTRKDIIILTLLPLEEMVYNTQKKLAIKLNSYCLCLYVLFKENADYYIHVSLVIMTVLLNKIQ